MEQTLPPPPGGPTTKTFAAKLAGVVAGHAHASLAMIVILAILVLSLYVYYHGLFCLGPFAPPRPGGRTTRGGKRKDPDGAADKSDPETERLIESINGR